MKSEGALAVGILGGALLLVILGILFWGIAPSGPPLDPMTETNSLFFFSAFALEYKTISTFLVPGAYLAWVTIWAVFAGHLEKRGA